jgi:hypothetical protein
MTTDDQRDQRISVWLEAKPRAELPDRVLSATFERTRRAGQHGRWRLTLQMIGMHRATIAVGFAAVLVLVLLGGTQLAALLRVGEAGIGAAPKSVGSLPTSPADWTRVIIDAQGEGRVESIAATPLGLLASVGESNDARWYVSPDGRSWTEVPSGRIPQEANPSFDVTSVAVAGDQQRILMVGREVLASADGMTWRRIAGPATDADLANGAVIAIASGGPGFVAVGAPNRAWHSTDGRDWTESAVPPTPGQPSRLDEPLDPRATQGIVRMEGVASSDRNLLAWGKSIWVHDDASMTFVPVFWRSLDGLSWTAVDPPGGPAWNYPKVAGGATGFLVTGEDGAAWLSTDGQTWESAGQHVFGDSRWATPSQPRAENADGIPVELIVGGLAAGPEGYVAAGTDGECLLRCGSEEAVVWTSRDGRSWTRLAGGDVFRGTPGSVAGSGAAHVVAWGSAFIVAGDYAGRPAVWISGSKP